MKSRKINSIFSNSTIVGIHRWKVLIAFCVFRLKQIFVYFVYDNIWKSLTLLMPPISPDFQGAWNRGTATPLDSRARFTDDSSIWKRIRHRRSHLKLRTIMTLLNGFQVKEWFAFLIFRHKPRETSQYIATILIVIFFYQHRRHS